MADPQVLPAFGDLTVDHDLASTLIERFADDDAATIARPIAVFTPLERQAVHLGLLEGELPIARGAHPNPIARALDWIVTALVGNRRGKRLASPRLESLRRF